MSRFSIIIDPENGSYGGAFNRKPGEVADADLQVVYLLYIMTGTYAGAAKSVDQIEPFGIDGNFRGKSQWGKSVVQRFLKLESSGDIVSRIVKPQDACDELIKSGAMQKLGGKISAEDDAECKEVVTVGDMNMNMTVVREFAQNIGDATSIIRGDISEHTDVIVNLLNDKHYEVLGRLSTLEELLKNHDLKKKSVAELKEELRDRIKEEEEVQISIEKAAIDERERTDKFWKDISKQMANDELVAANGGVAKMKTEALKRDLEKEKDSTVTTKKVENMEIDGAQPKRGRKQRGH